MREREREREENFFARGKGSVFEHTHTHTQRPKTRRKKKSARSKKEKSPLLLLSIPTFAPTGKVARIFPSRSFSLALNGGQTASIDRSRRARAAKWDIGSLGSRTPPVVKRDDPQNRSREMGGGGEIVQTQHPNERESTSKAFHGKVLFSATKNSREKARRRRRRRRRRTLILYAKYRFSTILLWTFGLFKSRSICVRVRLLLATCSSSSSSSEAKMRAVRSRSSIREPPPPPSSPPPDVFFRPRRRKPGMIDSSSSSSS